MSVSDVYFYSSVQHRIPGLIIYLISHPGAWLVGSALLKLENGEIPKDYDILVEDKKTFLNLVRHLRNQIDVSESVSKMGANKFHINQIVIDIWHQPLGEFLCNANRVSYILTLNPDVILLKSII